METMLKPIPGFADLYSASPDGRIYSHRAKRFLAGSSAGRGYPMVILWRDNVSTPLYIHRIIATLFIREPRAGETVNHRDGDRRNNAWTNLEWCTVAENLKHARETGLNKSSPAPRYGLTNHATKLTDDQVQAARARFAKGERNCDLAADFGLTPGGMSNILQRKKRSARNGSGPKV